MDENLEILLDTARLIDYVPDAGDSILGIVTLGKYDNRLHCVDIGFKDVPDLSVEDRVKRLMRGITNDWELIQRKHISCYDIVIYNCYDAVKVLGKLFRENLDKIVKWMEEHGAYCYDDNIVDISSKGIWDLDDLARSLWTKDKFKGCPYISTISDTTYRWIKDAFFMVCGGTVNEQK
jgi:hypothetical protein